MINHKGKEKNHTRYFRAGAKPSYFPACRPRLRAFATGGTFWRPVRFFPLIDRLTARPRHVARVPSRYRKYSIFKVSHGHTCGARPRAGYMVTVHKAIYRFTPLLPLLLMAGNAVNIGNSCTGTTTSRRYVRTFSIPLCNGLHTAIF